MDTAWVFGAVMNPGFDQTFKDCEIQVLQFWSGETDELVCSLTIDFMLIEVQMKSAVRIHSDDIL